MYLSACIMHILMLYALFIHTVQLIIIRNRIAHKLMQAIYIERE